MVVSVNTAVHTANDNFHIAVAIDVTEPHLHDDTAYVIRVEMARVDASKGMYTLDGQFIKAAHY